MMRQVFWFGVVGVAAMCTHFAVAAALLTAQALPPLLANMAGFMLAFPVSYGGHRWRTFAGARPRSGSLWRFLLVALGSFALNECLYAALLRGTGMEPRAALALVLLAVAALTFLASRHWAFAAERRA